MGSCISRRDFLRASSVAGVAAAVTPLPSMAATSAKSRVVIAKDPLTVTGTSTPNTAKIQEMVDAAVMALTGKTTKGAAYEALFPAAVTAATKILLKRNDISGANSAQAVNAAVVNAFKTGLTSMLNNSFPAANVTIRMAGGSAKTQLDASTYVINCPVCWCHGTDYGVTLSLKNTMTYLGPASNYHSANKSWLHTVSLNASVKPKQVLSLMDAVVGNNRSGPGGNPTFAAGTIILSKDIVAVDYQAVQIMKQQPSPSTARMATAEAQLTAAQTAGLGTCTPANMEIITITPPWTSTGLIGDEEQLRRSLSVEVQKTGRGFQFTLPQETAGSAELSVFDSLGHQLFATGEFRNFCVVWEGTTRGGARVPSGMYFYRINSAAGNVKGMVMVQ